MIQHIHKILWGNHESQPNGKTFLFIYFFFSGVVTSLASISITDDMPTVSNLDAIQSEEEQTSLVDDALPTATQVDIEQISKQLTLKLALKMRM